MKITLIPLTLFAAATTVAGLPSPLQQSAAAPLAGRAATGDASLPAEKRWCKGRGQSCWRVKRAADALSDSLRTSGAAGAATARPGSDEYQAQRFVDALALAAAASQPDPAAYYAALALADHFAPDSQPDLTTTTTASDGGNKPDKRWCSGRGQSCWKNKAKRTASAADDEDTDNDEHSNASASASASDKDKRWCMGRGQSCWKVKRAAESVARAIELGGDDDDDDDSSNDVVRRDPSPWCWGRGQSCWKTRRDVVEENDDDKETAVRAACHAPGGECARAERDLHAVYAVARGILDAYAEA